VSVLALRHVEGVLRGDGLRAAVLAALWGGAVYGAVMGAFGGLFGERATQILYSAAKVPILLAVTTALALPSFYVLNALLGLRADFLAALGAVIGAQGAVGVVLAALAPYTAVWYASTADYAEAIVFNGVMFAVASWAAQRALRRRYAHLIARDPRHRAMMRTWLFVYAFVGIQMAWVLRPFVGAPGARPTFFREGAWGNAYVEVAETVWQVVGR
jgi:hypothetical protein